jgi:hypothetical protein
LLGSALGVMATVSACELWVHNAMHHNPLLVTAAVLAGGAAFCALEPLLPKAEPDQYLGSDGKERVRTDGRVPGTWRAAWHCALWLHMCFANWGA